MNSFAGWKVLEQFPTRGAEADVFLVEKGSEKRVLKLYRYGIRPKTEVLAGVQKITTTHPHLLVPVLEYGDDKTTGCFFEMDAFIPEGTLWDFLAETRLLESDIFFLLKFLTKALAVLHQEGILHLDLKPGNILLRSRSPFSPILSDFGMSSRQDEAMSNKMTEAKGTAMYQSPESLTGVVSTEPLIDRHLLFDSRLGWSSKRGEPFPSHLDQ